MDYKKKYLKYKMKYLELKQKGGFNAELQELISQIPRYPDLPPDFVKYVLLQLKNINKVIAGKAPNDDKHVDMYRSIRAGGDGSFTNKISPDGLIRLSDWKLGILIENINYFYDLATHVNRGIKPALTFPDDNPVNFIRVYRSVDFQDGNVPENINQPIPFSCTWDINFPIYQWGGLDGSKQVLEIIIKKNTEFLSTSYPGDMSQIPKKFLLNNQEQLEVVLPPCKLKGMDDRTYSFRDENNRLIRIPIYTYQVDEYYTKETFFDEGIVNILYEDDEPISMEI